MKPAVLLMYRNEADIIYQTLSHWWTLGIGNFYLMDNASTDESNMEVQRFMNTHRCTVKCFYTDKTNWPGREVYNEMKNIALKDGCDWIFPIDADEQLALPSQFEQVQEWLSTLKPETHFCAYLIPYLNIFPTGRKLHSPQQKVFGRFTADWIISYGNHVIENTKMDQVYGAHYRHYPVRSYEQFYTKTTNYMKAMANNEHLTSHPHARNYERWKAEGDTFVQKLYDECLNTLIWPPE